MLSVTSSFFAGALTINLTDADNVAISAVGGNVQLTINGIGGFNPDTGVAQAADVNSIVVTGTGDFDNTIDLTGVNQSDYSMLATVNLDGGEGNDLYLIDQSILPAAAVVSVADTGLIGNDTLQLTSSGAGPETIGISASSVTRSSGPTVSYSGVEDLSVSGTAAADTFTVTGSPSGTTTLDGLEGGDTYTITQNLLDGPLTVSDSGASGTDSLTSQSTAAGPEAIGVTSSTVSRTASSLITYSGIENLSVSGTATADTFTVIGSPSGTTTLDGLEGGDSYTIAQNLLGGALSVSDSGASGTDTLSSQTTALGPEMIGVTSTTVSRTASPLITYSGIENLSVQGTAAADTFTVTGSPSGTTTLDGLGGGDTYSITQNLLGGSLSVSDSGLIGTDSLTSQSTAAGPEIIGINGTTVSRTASPLITYNGIENLTVKGTAA
ncbi:MAG TPA: hypothetical protein VMJ32_15475, partial [Pirellulales bacterium]|nr:hypothetical protein [Pirellulales bacterium]